MKFYGEKDYSYFTLLEQIKANKMDKLSFSKNGIETNKAESEKLIPVKILYCKTPKK